MAETFEQWREEYAELESTLKDAACLGRHARDDEIREKDERIAELEAKYEGLRQIHQADSEASYHIDVAHLEEVNSLKAKIAKLEKVVEAARELVRGGWGGVDLIVLSDAIKELEEE